MAVAVSIRLTLVSTFPFSNIHHHVIICGKTMKRWNDGCIREVITDSIWAKQNPFDALSK